MIYHFIADIYRFWEVMSCEEVNNTYTIFVQTIVACKVHSSISTTYLRSVRSIEHRSMSILLIIFVFPFLLLLFVWVVVLLQAVWVFVLLFDLIHLWLFKRLPSHSCKSSKDVISILVQLKGLLSLIFDFTFLQLSCLCQKNWVVNETLAEQKLRVWSKDLHNLLSIW